MRPRVEYVDPWRRFARTAYRPQSPLKGTTISRAPLLPYSRSVVGGDVANVDPRYDEGVNGEARVRPEREPFPHAFHLRAVPNLQLLPSGCPVERQQQQRNTQDIVVLVSADLVGSWATNYCVCRSSGPTAGTTG